ncbi:ATPase [Halobacillus andaensis]|uniref:ATPase n=1 Tax=Halobacillus andaensis TaxID=1176239 RepID=A0A917EYH1_HALAA|nr:heavy metal translocating P-type ATPase [Halobacillus andaensis]MBP2005950.1 Cd2+/Zn2+-exporting ATPase [Halobacillus andaensis]GGF24779.1 ATPase [Halobacillus andaensis]
MPTSFSLKKSLFTTQKNLLFSHKFFNHIELIAALSSGLILLVAAIFSNSLSSTAYISLHVAAFIIGGYAKAKEGITETIQEKQLNVELLMIFAAIGSASIGYWTEGAILIFIFALSGALETYTMNKSDKEIASLMDLQPNTAWKVTPQGVINVDTHTLQIGDHILIKAGERIPSDGIITKGSTTIDESAITGESLPVSKENGKEVFAGTVNLNGSIYVEITKLTEDTLFQKIIQMVKKAQSEKSHTQLFIERFESRYVKVVLITVAFMLFLPHYLFDWSWVETIYRAMILLVVASPCALVASIMPATLSAISNSARNGVLFKGGMHLENLAHIQAIAFDKTGTLTKGEPEVTDVWFRDSLKPQSVLSVAKAIEEQSNHPLAKAIVTYTNQYEPTPLSIQQTRDIPGKGVKADIDDETWMVGNAEIASPDESVAAYAEKLASEGKTIVFVANSKETVGLFALKDTVRPEAKKLISRLQKNNIYTLMLTGDNPTTAKSIAEEAGIDHYVAECLPQDKVNELQSLRKRYTQIAMVGDGVNDAPALATANVGIAMGEGTDVALETADLVLMKNDLSRLTDSITISHRMNKIVKQNIIFSISIIMLLIISNFLQVLDLPLGVIGHEGSTILVILNGLRLLR